MMLVIESQRKAMAKFLGQEDSVCRAAMLLHKALFGDPAPWCRQKKSFTFSDMKPQPEKVILPQEFTPRSC
jgi:hypothetical protein